MARIKWTKKDVNRAFEEALAGMAGQSQTGDGNPADRIRQMVLKNKSKLPKV